MPKPDFRKLPFLSIATIASCLFNAGVAYTEEKVISGVPNYQLYHCESATAVGMFFGYLDSKDYPGLMPYVDVDANTSITEAELECIVSKEHYEDYCLPLDTPENIIADRSELGGAHSHNCIADFLNSNFSSKKLPYSLGAWVGDTSKGIRDYFKYRYPELNASGEYGLWDMLTYENLDENWELIKEFINADMPVIAAISPTVVDGRVHAEASIIIGYKETDSKREFYAHTIHDDKVHLFSYAPGHSSFYVPTFIPNSLTWIFPIVPEANIHRSSVHQFYRKDVGSYFFTANEVEAAQVKTVQVFTYEAISHIVYSGKIIEQALPVYRFLNSKGAHFYTASEAEKDSVVSNLSHIYTLEGIAFYALGTPVGGAKPVYRFFQPSTKSHYFTISEEDKQYRIDNDKTMNFEGIAYYAFPQ